MQPEPQAKEREKIACIIPHFHGEDLLSVCLESLLPQLQAGDKVFIVNDQMDPLTDRGIFRHEKIRIIQNHQNLGYGRSCNVGVHLAGVQGYRHFLILNQDLHLADDMLHRLSFCLEDTQDAILFPLVYDYDLKDIEEHFRKRTLKGRSVATGEEPFTRTIEITHEVGAAGFLVGEAVWQRLGGFDPLFFMYGEDDDLFIRAGECGIKLLLCPKAIIGHKHALIEQGEDDPQIKNWQFRARMILTMRHRGGHFMKSLFMNLRHILREVSHFSFSAALNKTSTLFFIMKNLQNIRERNSEHIAERIHLITKEDASVIINVDPQLS